MLKQARLQILDFLVEKNRGKIYLMKIKKSFSKKIKYIVLFLLIIIFIGALIKNSKKFTQKPSDYESTQETGSKPGSDGEQQSTPPSGSIFPGGGIPTEEIPVATNEDWEHAQYWKEIYSKYPWYSKLPIEKESYRIIWDLEKESFRIRLKISENSSQEEKNILIDQAIEDIENITGEPIDKSPYYVLYEE